AQPGTLVALNSRKSSSGSLADGLKEYAPPASTNPSGVPAISGGLFEEESAGEVGGGSAAFAESSEPPSRQPARLSAATQTAALRVIARAMAPANKRTGAAANMTPSVRVAPGAFSIAPGAHVAAWLIAVIVPVVMARTLFIARGGERDVSPHGACSVVGQARRTDAE